MPAMSGANPDPHDAIPKYRACISLSHTYTVFESGFRLRWKTHHARPLASPALLAPEKLLGVKVFQAGSCRRRFPFSRSSSTLNKRTRIRVRRPVLWTYICGAFEAHNLAPYQPVFGLAGILCSPFTDRSRMYIVMVQNNS